MAENGLHELKSHTVTTLGRLSGGVGSGPDKISLDGWSFFIAVKSIEIGCEVGCWEL